MDKALRVILRDKPHRGYMGHGLGKVRELFYKRYGRMPERVVRSGVLLLAGPIPKEAKDGE